LWFIRLCYLLSFIRLMYNLCWLWKSVNCIKKNPVNGLLHLGFFLCDLVLASGIISWIFIGIKSFHLVLRSQSADPFAYFDLIVWFQGESWIRLAQELSLWFETGSLERWFVCFCNNFWAEPGSVIWQTCVRRLAIACHLFMVPEIAYCHYEHLEPVCQSISTSRWHLKTDVVACQLA